MAAKKENLQYIIRQVPSRVVRELRRRTHETGKSLNQVSLDALILGTNAGRLKRRDFTDIAGYLNEVEANFQDSAVQRQRRIDPKIWK